MDRNRFENMLDIGKRSITNRIMIEMHRNG